MKFVLATILLIYGSGMSVAGQSDALQTCLMKRYIQSFEKAEAACAIVINDTLTPKETKIKALLRLAKIHRTLTARFDLARNYLDQVLDLSPNDFDARVGYCWVLFYTGDLQGSFEGFTKLLEERPDSADPYFGIAYLYSVGKQPENAVWAYEQGLKIDPGALLLQYNLSVELIDMNNSERGIALLEDLLKKPRDQLKDIEFSHPYPELISLEFDDAIIWLLASSFLDGHGGEDRRQESLTLLTELDKRIPKNQLILAQRAISRNYLGDFAGGLVDARASNSRPESEYSPAVRAELEALYSLKLYKDVIKRAETAVQRPVSGYDSAWIYFWLGSAQEMVGRNQEAHFNLERARSVSPAIENLLLNRITETGYYEGRYDDEYSERASDGVMACIIDPEC